MKTVILGIDAATWDIIHILFKKGKLNNLKKIVEKGASGILKSVIPPLTPPAWISMATGVNPGKHGIYDFVEQNLATMEISITDYSKTKRRALWDILSSNKKKVIIANYPATYPPHHVNGIFISGISSPEEGDYAWPKKIKNELKKYKYSIHPKEPYIKAQNYYDQLIEMIEIKFKSYEYLLNEYSWDLFWGVFNEIDWGQHYLWDKKELIYNLYEKWDELFGDFMKLLNEDTNIIVCSDHGMKEIKGEIHFNSILKKWGYLKTNEVGIKNKNILKKVSEMLPFKLKRIIKQIIPQRIKKVIASRIGSKYDEYMQIDWDQTSVYSYGYLGKVYFNKELTENELIAIKDKILDLSNPINGNKIFEKIIMKEEIYWGAYLENAPSMVLIPYNWDYMIYNNFEEEWYSEPKKRKADHCMDGVFIWKGPNIKNGAKVNLQIYDILPNILVENNIRIYNDLDGQYKKELFKKPKKPVEIDYQESDKNRTSDMHNHRESIKEKLSDLGYF